MMSDAAAPHRRYNPLDDSWVLVSPQRTQRPWQGEELAAPPAKPAYAEDCYLCPGNQRADGQRNPEYASVFTFDNDFPALLAEAPADMLPVAGKGSDVDSGGLFFRTEAAAGRCRVLCYSPRHDQSLGDLSAPQRLAVIEAWAAEYQGLIREYPWVQIFENRGAAMGASNPHPHGQVWAVSHLPSAPAREARSQSAYYEKHRRPLLLDYAEAELDCAERVVYSNPHWLIVVPHWAAWPFETLLLPRRAIPSLAQLTAAEKTSLAQALGQLQQGYDALFACEFPYSFGWHNAPAANVAGSLGLKEETLQAGWQLHAHFYPPLLRSASVKKFMVGYEMMAEPQRDLTAETAAVTLRQALAGER